MRLPRIRGFTLLELLTVVSVLAVLAGLVSFALGGGKRKSTTSRCMEQLRQLGLAMTLYADDSQGLLPAAHGVVTWDHLKPQPWTRPLLPYYSATNVLECPEFSRAYHRSRFSYFMGSRAAFVEAGGQAASLQYQRIQWPSQYILSGDSNFPFLSKDADPDNYTQDTLFGTNSPAHGGQVNILFADHHIQAAPSFAPQTMTHSYSQPGIDWGY